MSDHPPDSEIAIRVIAMPADTNLNGDIFGGWLMSHMDLAAGTAAFRRARGRVVTVAVDSMTFLKPVSVGDEVTMYAVIKSTGRSSIRIVVEAWRRGRDTGASVKVTEATFIYVAIDDSGRPTPLPDADMPEAPA
jgi:acyl-CoA thioesterase YciA